MAQPLTQRPFAIQRWCDAFKQMLVRSPYNKREFADRAGVSTKLVDAWLDGEELPTAEQLKRMYTMFPALKSRNELWRNEVIFAKQPELKPRPMPETKRPPAPPPVAIQPVAVAPKPEPPRAPAPAPLPPAPLYVPKPEAIAERLAAGAIPAQPAEPPADDTAIAQAGVRYALARADVKAATARVEQAKLDRAEALRAANDKVVAAEADLRAKTAAVDEARKALDEAVDNTDVTTIAKAPAAAFVKSTDDDDAAVMLLRAGGMLVVRRATLAIYRFLLNNSTKAWTADDIAARLKMNRQNVSHILGRLLDRDIIVRVGVGQYKAK